MSNLHEYLTGGDPLAADGHLAPKIVTQGTDALFEFQIRAAFFRLVSWCSL